MLPEQWTLYALMLKSRLLEEAIAGLWHEGLISGEMHLGTGEEAIIAGIVSQLQDYDAMALDHRGTAALVMRGVDPVLIIRELLGRDDGLCRGMGGHMHLFSKEYLAASSGIVGAEGPAAAGFALSAQHLHPGAVAVAFFGEGAMNQGMLMESLNLAAVWKLPVLFVCKDDGWSITARSQKLTGGDLNTRVRGLGVPVVDVDGCDALAVNQAAAGMLEKARDGKGPAFLHARCHHFEGHFLGYQLLRMVREPLQEMPDVAIPLTGSLLAQGGASWRERLTGLTGVLEAVLVSLRNPRQNSSKDPIPRLRKYLLSDPARLQELEGRIEAEAAQALSSAVAEGVS